MKVLVRLYPTVFVVAALAVAGQMAGCDSTSSGSSSILVEPSSADIIGQGSAVFTAVGESEQELILPLEWSVDNLSLGAIRESGGLTAVYVSTGADGSNAITVRDASGREGVAAVNQIEPANSE